MLLNNISVISRWSLLLVEETRVLGEKQRPIAKHWQLNLSLYHYTMYQNKSGRILYIEKWCDYEKKVQTVIVKKITNINKTNKNSYCLIKVWTPTVSKWSLLKTKWAIFDATSWQEQWHQLDDDDDVRFVQDQHS